MGKRWFPVWRRRDFERQMNEEMAFHIERRARDLELEGLAPEAALRQARVEFGSAERVREECRESRKLGWIDEIGRNARFGWRMVVRKPLSAVVAIVTLALCIGANTAIYSVVDSIFLRPLPYPEPDRLVQVVMQYRADKPGVGQALDGRTWELLRDGVQSLEVAVFKVGATGVNFSTGSKARFLREQRVSAGFFRVLGVAPLAGREFSLEEDRRGGPAVVMLSSAIWRTAFGADPGLLGRTIQLKGEAHTVIGILPEGLETTAKADVFTPIRADQKGEGSGSNFAVMGRLKPGTNWAEAAAEVETLGASIAPKDRPESRRPRLLILPLLGSLGADVKFPLLLLQASAALVLLIGCLNIGGLMIARSSGRVREVATRLAIGGGRGAVLRQFLTENLLLSLAGGVLGIALGFVLVDALRWLVPEGLVWRPFAINARVMGVAAVLSVACGLLFGLLPAWRASRVDVRGMLVDRGRSVAGSSKHWPRRLLVVGEVALALAVLSGAAMLLRTFWKMQTIAGGFDESNLVSAQVSLMDKRYEDASKVQGFFDSTLKNLRETPGVENAAIGLTLPFERPLNLGIKTADGWQAVNMTYVSDGFFETLRMPMLRGRGFVPADSAGSGRVIVVNQAFVKAHVPDGNPIGRIVQISNMAREIVGVTADTAQNGAGVFGGAVVAAIPGAYMPASQVEGKAFALFHVWFSPRIVVRSGMSRTQVEQALMKAIETADSGLPVAEFRDMDELRSQSTAKQRFLAVLLSSMAGLGLLLAALGVYGIVADSVSERTREMGVRMAIGARATEIVGQVVRGSLGLVLVGIAAGGLGSLYLNRVLRSSIWSADGAGLDAVAAVAVLLVAVGMVAALIPAWRVTRINPAETLRAE